MTVVAALGILLALRELHIALGAVVAIRFFFVVSELLLAWHEIPPINGITRSRTGHRVAPSKVGGFCLLLPAIALYVMARSATSSLHITRADRHLSGRSPSNCQREARAHLSMREERRDLACPQGGNCVRTRVRDQMGCGLSASHHPWSGWWSGSPRRRRRVGHAGRRSRSRGSTFVLIPAS